VETRDEQVQWRDWKRYSARQDVKMKLGGFVGGVEYRGELGPFFSLLQLGERLNIGKGTGFGLRRYRIVSRDQGKLSGLSTSRCS
jgi:hypothetical protein